MIDYFVDFHAESLVDSKDAYIYYELQQQGSGERFLRSLAKNRDYFNVAPCYTPLNPEKLSGRLK